MSTTRTTSDRIGRLPYTVVGGSRWDRVRKYPYPLTLLVLSRGDRLFRAELLHDLSSRGIGEILWVEGDGPMTDIESLSRDFPEVRFLLLKSAVTAGEKLNIGIGEARAPVVLSMWSDTRLSVMPPSFPASIEKSGALCTVPAVQNSRREPVPSWQSPTWRKRRFSLSFRVPRKEGEATLFPFDYCGIYNRQKFEQSGGYDSAIVNPYWQKMDFGFRCFLWGDRLHGTTEISLTYTGAPPEEDTTADQGYKLFWLKNIAVRMRREMGVLPLWRIFEYMTHSDTGPLYAVKEFRAVRGWVRIHRFRFRRDPRDLFERWETA